MQSETLSQGDKIEARCTKCRKNSPHLIVSLSDGQPEQVQCQVCDRQHKFRPPTKVRSVSLKLASEKRAAENEKWEQVNLDSKTTNAKAYSMDMGYKVDTLINHPSFGVGVVQRLAGVRKMEVLFEKGTKILRCK